MRRVFFLCTCGHLAYFHDTCSAKNTSVLSRPSAPLEVTGLSYLGIKLIFVQVLVEALSFPERSITLLEAFKIR